MYVKGPVRNWIHYLEVRSDPSTQKEHRLVAYKAAEAIAPIFPMITNFTGEQNG
jgi:thymidylate synthase (FAD)